MKVGSYKVKRNYLIPQMAVDAFSVVILVVIFSCTMYFRSEILGLNQLILAGNSEIEGLVQWYWNIIWFVMAILITGFSLFLIYRPKKLPKKYKITEATAQKYNDIYITAVTCVRIPVLLAIFEGMCMHQNIMKHNYSGLFTLQIPLDILLTAIIIRFSIYRVRALEPKQEKSHEIKEG